MLGARRIARNRGVEPEPAAARQFSGLPWLADSVPFELLGQENGKRVIDLENVDVLCAQAGAAECRIPGPRDVQIGRGEEPAASAVHAGFVGRSQAGHMYRPHPGVRERFGRAHDESGTAVADKAVIQLAQRLDDIRRRLVIIDSDWLPVHGGVRPDRSVRAQRDG